MSARSYAPASETEMIRPAKHAVEDTLRAPGASLPLDQRRNLESRFGHDFSTVRVHTDARARASARAVDASAYTVGEHVVVDTENAGPSVLAHEMTHVVRQRASTRAEGGGGATAERESASAAAGSDTRARVHSAVRAGSLQRDTRRRTGSTLPYREATEMIERERFFTPAAARVTDPRQTVLPADRATVDRIVTFIEQARTRIGEVIAQPHTGTEAWLTERNQNIQRVLQLMTQFVMDVRNGGIVIRFDQPAGGSVIARYSEGENMLHLRPVGTGPDDLPLVVPSVLHEYAHAIQDRESMRILAARGRPSVHTREAELAKETEARMVDVYAAKLLSEARMGPRDFNAMLSVIYETASFHADFERQRTGSRRARAAATRSIRRALETPYASQLAANAPSGQYLIEITGSSTAILTHPGPGGTPVETDLGAVPANLQTIDALRHRLATMLRAMPSFNALFAGARGQRYRTARFVIFYRHVDGGERIIGEFDLEDPNLSAAPATPTAPARPATGTEP